MNRKQPSASFTLVEMLVSLAIFSILALVLCLIMSNTTRLWTSQSGKEDGFREARAAMSTLSREMTTALISSNENWFFASSNQMAFLTRLPEAAQSTNGNRGDLCAVGYSLEWGVITNRPSEKNGQSLYRYIRFSDPTYATIIQGGDPVKTIFDSPDGTSTVRELLARNVSQITFDLYTNNPSGEPEPLTESGTMPDVVNVTMTVLNDATAAILTTQAQWQNTNSPVIRQNEESFTLRVRPGIP